MGDLTNPADYKTAPPPPPTEPVRRPVEATLRLLAELDAIALRHGGRTYPAKDNHMTPGHFQACYPTWRGMTPFLDPAFSSGFWRRVTA